MLHKPKSPIDPEKYYLPSAVREMYPVLQGRTKQWLYMHIRDKAPQFFVNTAPDGGRPSLLIRGSDIPAFLDTFNIRNTGRK